MTDTTRIGLPPAAPLRPEGLRLIAVDMDGTFLGAGMPGTYDRARFAPLRRRMRERGVRFVVASGNQEHQIAGYFEGDVGGAALSPDGIVSDNGAIVAAGRRRLLESAMPPEALGAALAVLADYPDIGIIGSGPRGAVVPEDQDPELRELLVRYHTRFRLVPDRAHIADHRVAKLAIVDPRGLDPALPARLDAALGATVTAVTSGHESIDLIVTGRHKASGLDLLLDHWGLGREQVAAFGDSPGRRVHGPRRSVCPFLHRKQPHQPPRHPAAGQPRAARRAAARAHGPGRGRGRRPPGPPLQRR